MPEIESDKEGNATHADDDEATSDYWQQKLWSEMTERNNRIRQIIAISKNQDNIMMRPLATRIEPEAEKHPMDMTLDELYKAYLRSIRKGNLKPEDKETEETEETKNRNRLQEEQISKNIDRANGDAEGAQPLREMQRAQPSQPVGQVLPRTLHPRKGNIERLLIAHAGSTTHGAGDDLHVRRKTDRRRIKTRSVSPTQL